MRRGPHSRVAALAGTLLMVGVFGGCGGVAEESGGQAGAAATAGSAGSSSTGGRAGSSGSSGMGGTTGGLGGKGGASGSGGSATGGVGGGVVDGGSACPASMPLAGSACAPGGLTCSYGECCPTMAFCDAGRWTIAITDCAPPSCPVGTPDPGTPCSCGLICRYDYCSTQGRALVASCEQGAWLVLGEACAIDAGAACTPGGMFAGCELRASDVCTTSNRPNFVFCQSGAPPDGCCTHMYAINSGDAYCCP